MIVLDASAVVELLLGTEMGHVVADAIGDPEVSLHVPHLLDVEIAQVLRRYVRDGELTPAEAAAALADLQALDLQRHGHEPLLHRIWTLRQNLTAHDAAYVALAEGLDAPLLTGDARLARSAGATADIEVVRT